MKVDKFIIYLGIGVVSAPIIMTLIATWQKGKNTGYSNASGTSKAFPNKCRRCRDLDGNIYVPDRNSNCLKGETCLS